MGSRSVRLGRSWRLPEGAIPGGGEGFWGLCARRVWCGATRWWRAYLSAGDGCLGGVGARLGLLGGCLARSAGGFRAMRARWCAMLQTCGIGAGVGRGWLAGGSCEGLSGGGGAWRGAVAGWAAAKLVGGPVFLELHFHVAVRAAVFVRLGKGFGGRGAGCHGVGGGCFRRWGWGNGAAGISLQRGFDGGVGLLCR